MLIRFSFSIVILSTIFLSGCSNESSEATDNFAGAAISVIDSASAITLPEDAPEIGTDINDVVIRSIDSTDDEDGVTEIAWDDLVPDAFKPDVIWSKYQSQIDAVEVGTAEEIALYTKINDEFNLAPTNTALAGKTVKLPGFVSPLDENNGMVGEFLLVPYFGSCIHSPPPPVNQTILVKPLPDKSIAMADIYSPVWVIGEVMVEPITTDLAQAGYQILNARLEPYEAEN